MKVHDNKEFEMSDPDKVVLNKIVAVVTGKKTRVEKLLGDAHHQLTKKDATSGRVRTFQPLQEEDESRARAKPEPEIQTIQVHVDDVIAQLMPELEGVWDTVATQEIGNTVAKADVVLDGKTIVTQAPVGVLLYLEKRLEDLRTFVRKIPTLSPDKSWTWDQAQACHMTPVESKERTKKVPTPLVQYEATDKHPAQTTVIDVDTVVGYWKETFKSAAWTVQKQRDCLGRIDRLADAVKMAREEANSTEVEQKKIAKGILDFIFSTK